VGRPRAEALIENLVEMNPKDVKGKAFSINPLEILKDLDKLRKYSLLICGDLPESATR
jgi:hypothetical protein